jgi:hypothetical protein
MVFFLAGVVCCWVFFAMMMMLIIDSRYTHTIGYKPFQFPYHRNGWQTGKWL